jgi:AcrR family transcriptional regulator
MSTSTRAADHRSRRERNKASRRAAILAAAGKLFGRGTYDAVQMDDVARAAGIGKPALYRYFPSKQDLFLEVSDRALGELEQALETAAGAGLSAEMALSRMAELLVAGLRGHFASLRLLSGEHPIVADRWRILFRKRRRAINAALTEVLRKGIADGDFRPVDTTLAPGIIVGMVRGAMMEAPDTPAKHIAAAIIPIVLGGVKRVGK